jgi:hypothetical protein
VAVGPVDARQGLAGPDPVHREAAQIVGRMPE